MASNSELTFGSRLANASKISTQLKSFTAFVAPTTNTSIANYDALIAALTTENANIATKKALYSAAVEQKQKLLFKDEVSIIKLLSPITAAVKSKLGKKSKPATDIAALVVKIRGEKKAKSKEPKPEDKSEATKISISQSERSFGSITQNFNDIISTLSSLGEDYAPVNDVLKITALTTTLANVKAANDAATNAYSVLKMNIDQRLQQYDDLKERTQRIKDSVKSQYGKNSTEYKLIKGIKV